MRALLATLFFLSSGPAAAFCGTYVGSPGVELTNQTSQVIISRQGTRTTLTLANDYEGDATDFAMLIPVPTVLGEDDITTVRPELFQRFDNYSAPRVVTYECEDYEDDYSMDGDGDTDADADSDADADADPGVIVEAEYEVGIYDIVILSAEESGSLLAWLTSNGYGVDADAEDLLAEYIEAGSYFFAAKVNLELSSEGGFLEPLQFGYDSAVFSLPVRLGTINSPGEQDVVMYILTDDSDGKVGISNYPKIEVEDECMADIYGAGGVDNFYGGKFANQWLATDGAAWMVEYAWATSWCDPCASEPPTNNELDEAGFDGERSNTFFTRIRMRYTPEAATQDVTLYASGLRENEQIRYIIYNEQMENRFPVCGVGMVEDPGSCDDELETDEPDDTDSDDTDSDDEGGGPAAENGWSREDGVDGSGSAVDDDKGGCSATNRSPSSIGWPFLLAVMGIFGRRRSAL